jgi:hypothetical protein
MKNSERPPTGFAPQAEGGRLGSAFYLLAVLFFAASAGLTVLSRAAIAQAYGGAAAPAACIFELNGTSEPVSVIINMSSSDTQRPGDTSLESAPQRAR